MTPEELLNKRREEFITKRVIIENNVNEYMSRVLELREQEPALFKDVIFPVGKTAREILPALYEEPHFNKALYEVQLEALYTFANKCQAIADKVNEEALRCLYE